MIKFKVIKWKNFLSTGQQFIEYDFIKSPTTLIIGKNGNGKSQILDAITFVLFGLPFRKIRKDKLINSINKKETEVTLTFDIGVNNYEVTRSIRPNKLEVYVDGKLQEREGNVMHQQRKFENEILQLNYNSFCQIVMLGSSFIPFMKLSRSQRRDIIEDILDLKVFSEMKKVLKQNTDTNNKELAELELNIDSKKNTYNVLNQLGNSSLVYHKKKEMANSLKRKQECKTKLQSLVYERKKLESNDSNTEDVSQEINKLSDVKSKIFHKSNDFKELKDFLGSHSECPVCSQSISSTFRTTKSNELSEQLEKFKIANSKIVAKLESLQQKQKKYQDLKNELLKVNNLLNIEKNNYNYITNTIDSLNKDLNNITNENRNIEEEKNQIQTNITNLNQALEKVIQQKDIYEICRHLLKDEVVKAKVVDYYIPIINNKINELLSDMEFHINFEFDSDFSESIRSRGVDVFNYDSFSEGEKARIDIAILLALNFVAKNKNSVSTNILFLDEVFDSSLDTDGANSLHQIFKSFHDINITCISHRTGIESWFDRIIQVSKINNFTIFEEVQT